jgi:hypothetical protein
VKKQVLKKKFFISSKGSEEKRKNVDKKPVPSSPKNNTDD